MLEDPAAWWRFAFAVVVDKLRADGFSRSSRFPDMEKRRRMRCVMGFVRVCKAPRSSVSTVFTAITRAGLGASVLVVVLGLVSCVVSKLLSFCLPFFVLWFVYLSVRVLMADTFWLDDMGIAPPTAFVGQVPRPKCIAYLRLLALFPCYLHPTKTGVHAALEEVPGADTRGRRRRWG